MSINLSEVEDVRKVIITQQISAAGVPVYNFTYDINNLGQQPHFAIVRAVDAISDTLNRNIYVLESSLTDAPLCTFTGSGYSEFPNSLIPIRKPIQQIRFNLSQVGSPTLTLGGAWMLAITIDFIRLKSYTSSKTQDPFNLRS